MKNFDKWNDKKKNIDREDIKFFFREREVRWCNLGINIGKEINGHPEYFSRPVLIIKKLNKHTCAIIPLSKTKIESMLLRKIIINNKVVKINFGQLKIISSKRLDKLITTLNKNLFKVVITDLKNFL